MECEGLGRLSEILREQRWEMERKASVDYGLLEGGRKLKELAEKE